MRVRKSGQIERKRINIKPGSLAKHLKTSVYFILNIEFNPQQNHCAWPIYVIMHMQIRLQTGSIEQIAYLLFNYSLYRVLFGVLCDFMKHCETSSLVGKLG